MVIGLGVLQLVLQVLVIFITESWLDFLAQFVAVFFMSLCLALLLSVFAPGRITMNRALGAIAVYLLFAMFFAESFDIVDRFTEGDAFIMGHQPTPYTTPGARYFYLSVISLTSVGFGDMAPVHPFARSLVMLEAILGQIYTTVILAWMVSLAVRDDRSRPRAQPLL